MLFSLGQYNVLERIGAGGMGEVYRARDTRLGRTVAIKILPEAIAADRDRRERFLREARASAALSHPNVAMLFEVGEEGERLYLVSEYIAGRTLGATIAGRPLGVRVALALAVQIADGLADAHAAGVVHRDIQPDNILVTPKEKAKILDFGLAHWTEGGAARESAATMLQTAAGTFLGTIAYMSPEQALGQPIDARTDIFSLGVVLYEMLTGRHPFMADLPTATAHNIIQRDPKPPSALKPDIPRELDSIVLKALAKKPDDRYETAATLAAELRSVASMVDIRAGDAEPLAYAVRRGRPRVSRRAVMSLLAALVVGVAAWWGSDAARRLWRTYVAAPLAPRIAVLPLEQREAGGRTYFADGLTEDLIARLGQVPGLEVLGRSATRDLRGAAPAAAAARLGAEAVLSGTVSHEAGALKVSLELVDAADGVVVWTRQYTRPVGGVFAMQAEIAEDVARALRLKLAGHVRERAAARTVSARAYDLYLQAREASARRDLSRAVDLFEQALAADDGLAEAHAGLAEALYLRTAFEGRGFDADTRRRIAQEADSAAAIDPDLPEAALAAGLAASGLREALEHLRRAVTLDQSYADAYHEIGDQIIGFDPATAIRYYERSRSFDRNLIANDLDQTSAYTLLEKFDDARRTAAALPPGPMAVGLRAILEWNDGQPLKALALERPLVRSHAMPPSVIANFARVAIDAGRPDEALQTLDGLPRSLGDNCDVIAVRGGLLLETGRRAEAQSVFGRASASPRCDALVAAARGDGAAAAAALRRIAEDEPALREWTRIVTGATDHMGLQRGWYPWSKVADQPPLADAKGALEAARIDLRRIALDALMGLI